MNAMPPRLLRLRLLATGLLLLMIVLFAVARWLEPGRPAWGFVRAFAEAALVGGLADWFAVTALFRQPLGLPIPHTAIIPANKDRLADGVAEFLQQNFLTRRVLAEQLAPLDAAAFLCAMLRDEPRRRWLAAQLAAAAGSTLRPGRLLAAWLNGQLDRQRHQLWFGQVIAWARRTLTQHHADIYQKVSEKSPRWMPRRVNDELYQRLMDGLDELLDELLAPDSAARAQFAHALREQAGRLAAGERDDAILGALAGAGEGGQAGLLAGQIDASLAAIADRLDADPARRAALNGWLRRQAVVLIVRRRNAIVGLVRRVIDGWDAQTAAARVEARVGPDLQFIRINGTLVGGAVGALLHIISITF